MRKNRNSALTTEQKVMKGYKAYCGAVIGTALIMATAVPVFAAPVTDPLTVVNNLRNLMGPHHAPVGEEPHPGPGSFRKLPSVWTKMQRLEWNEDYCFTELTVE